MRRIVSPFLIAVCLIWWFRFGADLLGPNQAQSSWPQITALTTASTPQISSEKNGIRRPLHNKTKAFDTSVVFQEPEHFIALSSVKNIQEHLVSVTPVYSFLLRAPPAIRF